MRLMLAVLVLPRDGWIRTTESDSGSVDSLLVLHGHMDRLNDTLVKGWRRWFCMPTLACVVGLSLKWGMRFTTYVTATVLVKVVAAYRGMWCKCTRIFRSRTCLSRKTGSALDWASFWTASSNNNTGILAKLHNIFFYIFIIFPYTSAFAAKW